MKGWRGLARTLVSGAPPAHYYFLFLAKNATLAFLPCCRYLPRPVRRCTSTPALFTMTSNCRRLLTSTSLFRGAGLGGRVRPAAALSGPLCIFMSSSFPGIGLHCHDSPPLLVHGGGAHTISVRHMMAGGPKPKKPRQKKAAAAAANAGAAAKESPKPKKKQKKAPPPPPAYLHPTASPYVYIASCAAVESGIDPRSLFADVGNPPSFQHSQFEYVSPKALGHDLPSFPLPEVCFLGKSNVGKSSLINALTKSKDLARISKRPGRTQQVNYFALIKKDKCINQGKGVGFAFRPSDSTGFLIDLPGYGYAAAPDEKVTDWQANTQNFLLERRDTTYLKRLYLLIDARHGVANFDRAVMGWFDEASIPYSIVLTKADRVIRPQLVRFVNDVCMRYHSQMYGEASEGYQGPVVHVTSSKTGEGIEPLMWSIDSDFVEV